jgi:hypothetical protein
MAGCYYEVAVKVETTVSLDSALDGSVENCAS